MIIINTASAHPERGFSVCGLSGGGVGGVYTHCGYFSAESQAWQRSATLCALIMHCVEKLMHLLRPKCCLLRCWRARMTVVSAGRSCVCLSFVCYHSANSPHLVCVLATLQAAVHAHGCQHACSRGPAPFWNCIMLYVSELILTPIFLCIVIETRRSDAFNCICGCPKHIPFPWISPSAI